jgi:F-type H+-transporting ATPase subunit epsilon
MKLEITTPERRLVSTDIDAVQIPGKAGYMGILPLHAPLVSELAPGVIEYRTAGRSADSPERLAVSWGYVEVLPQQVSVLAETAEKAEEIDVPRAESARKRAEERIRTPGKDVDLERAMASLSKAMARLGAAKK